MATEKFNIETARHSLSHVLAAAVMDLFPGAKIGIGPAIENGFYYDFDLATPFVPSDISKIEKKMREIINKDFAFEKSDESKKEALKFFEKAVQPYKVELINGLEDENITFYKLDDFVDLCKGPHVASTSELKNLGWKLDKIAGAYWKGDEKNKMMQRIYALAFETKEELQQHEEMLIEAAKRDHKNFGKQMDLFSFHPECPGMPFWHEKGMTLWNVLENYGKSLRKKYGYVEIKTPEIAKNSLFITSGHWEHYKESMFSFDVDKETYCIKPMDCPMDIKIYQTKPRSYRELPIRYTEIGRVYRHEKSGELNGLFRVQQITQDDSHIFLSENQVTDEIVTLLQIVKEYYKTLGLVPEFFLSTRPIDFIGEIPTWDKAEKDLKKALDQEKIKYQTKEKDGAFYGPKIDVNIADSLGRSWQVATIQLDFQLPGRFKCEYIDDKGEMKTPVMIHAAIFGSFERMIGILLESYAGVLPLWLAPIQAIVLPIADRHTKYAQEIVKELLIAGVRAEIDNRTESIGRKIRDAEMQKIPYMLIIGDKEIEAKKVAVRKYGEGDKGQIDTSKLIKEIIG